MNFCTKCGSRLEADLKFCTQCGAPVSAPTPPEATGMGSIQPGEAEQVPQMQAMAAPEPPRATEWQASPVSPTQQYAATTNKGCLRTVVIALSVLALVASARHRWGGLSRLYKDETEGHGNSAQS